MMDYREAANCEVGAFNSSDFVAQNCKKSKITYTIECLISLSESVDCKELPTGVDQSIFSELEDVDKDAPKSHILHGLKSLSVSETCGTSAHKSPERWDFFKLASADSKSSDFEGHNENQFRRPWQKPVTMGISRSSSQNPEQSSILGGWSNSNPSATTSEMPASKPRGTESLLGRCSEPYRPPFYKAHRHSEKQIHDNKTFGFAEDPSKLRATEGSWRKPLPEITSDKPLLATEEKQKSNQKDEFMISNAVEPPCCAEGAGENCLTEDSLNPLLQDAEVTYHVEKLHPQILEGGRFCALINLEDAEDPDLIAENLACNDKPIGNQREILAHVTSNYMLKKETRSHVSSVDKRKENRSSNVLQVNISGKTSMQSSGVKSSVNSNILAKPSFRISSTHDPSASQKLKSIGRAMQGLQNGITEATSARHNLPTETQIFDGPLSGNWQSSDHNEKDRYWPDLSGKNIWGAPTAMIIKENVNKGNSQNTSISFQNRPDRVKTETAECERSSWTNRDNVFLRDIIDYYGHDQGPELEGSTDPQSNHAFGDEADTNFEIILPDEDSLITVDDTFIFMEELLNTYLDTSSEGKKSHPFFSGSNKPMRSETRESLHQNLSLPGQCFQAQLNSLPQLQEPWRIHRVDQFPPWRIRRIDQFPAEAISCVQLPSMPQIYEPSVQHFLSPRAPQAHIFNSPFNNTIPAYQVPCLEQKPDLPINPPLNHQERVNLSSMGMRGLPAQKVSHPTFSDILQMQSRKAQKNPQTALGCEQTAYGFTRQDGAQPTFSEVPQMKMRMAQMNLEAAPGNQQATHLKPLGNKIW